VSTFLREVLIVPPSSFIFWFAKGTAIDVTGMFIRFISGGVDEDSRVRAGLFSAAYDLRENGWLPPYEFEVLIELLNWFNDNLRSPSDYLPHNFNKPAVCWFKPSAHQHLARAWEMAAILERNDILIWTIKSATTGYIYYEDDVQVFAVPVGDLRKVLKR